MATELDIGGLVAGAAYSRTFSVETAIDLTATTVIFTLTPARSGAFNPINPGTVTPIRKASDVTPVTSGDTLLSGLRVRPFSGGAYIDVAITAQETTGLSTAGVVGSYQILSRASSTDRTVLIYGSVTVVEPEVADATSGLPERVTVAESNIISVTARVTTAEADIAALETRVTDLEEGSVLTGGTLVVRPQDFGSVTAGVDAYSVISEAMAYAKANRLPLYLPRIGGTGYYTSQTLVFDYDGATVYLDDDVTLTKTDPTDFVGPDAAYQSGVNGCGLITFLFAGILQGPRTKSYIQAPQLIGLRRVTVNGNGAAAFSNYTYVVGSAGQHAPVTFRGTVGGTIKNIIAKNGLVFGIDCIYCPEILIDRCVGVEPLYDNGIQVNANREHIAAFSDTDPRTWANATIRDCMAIRCRNHGIGAYGSVGVNIINPVTIECGNDGPARHTGGTITDAGPAGGINAEMDGTNHDRDYRVSIVNPRVYRSMGFGIRSGCKGTKVYGGLVQGTRTPTDVTYVAADTGNLWGCAVFAQGAATVDLYGTEIDGSERFGVRMALADNHYPTVTINGGKISGCVKRAIYGQGIGKLTISPATEFIENGNTEDTTAGDQYCIDISNAADNTDGGSVQIAGHFEDNYGGIAKLSKLDAIDLSKGITGRNNGRAWASQYIMINVPDTVQTLYAGNITLDDANGKSARIAQVQIAARAYVHRESIIGRITSTVFEPFEIITVTNLILGTGPSNVIYPSFSSSYTPNSANGNVTFSSVTGNITINSNTTGVPPIDGQIITFTFIQDATGGHTITWNASWRGAHPTTAGTAGQRAVVTFRYSASQWVLMSSTGWY